MLRSLFALAAIAAVLLAAPAHAHHAPSHRVKAPDAPASDVAYETVGGTLESLPVLDMRTGASVRYFSSASGGRHARGGEVARRRRGDRGRTGAARRPAQRRHVLRRALGDAATPRTLRSAKRCRPERSATRASSSSCMPTTSTAAAATSSTRSRTTNGGHVAVRFPVAPGDPRARHVARRGCGADRRRHHRRGARDRDPCRRDAARRRPISRRRSPARRRCW